jgi:hypothetical protein
MRGCCCCCCRGAWFVGAASAWIGSILNTDFCVCATLVEDLELLDSMWRGRSFIFTFIAAWTVCLQTNNKIWVVHNYYISTRRRLDPFIASQAVSVAVVVVMERVVMVATSSSSSTTSIFFFPLQHTVI